MCHTFNLSQAENLEIHGSVKLSFWLKPIQEVLERGIHGKIFLHSGKDLPNAGEHSSLLDFYPEQNNYTQYPDFWYDPGTYWQVEYTIAKENIKIEPSKKNPCGDLYPESCYDFQLNKFIQEKLHCHIPLLYTGSHTEQNQSLPVCSNQEILYALQMEEGDIQDKCEPVVPCEHSRYHMISKTWRKYLAGWYHVSFYQNYLLNSTYSI